MPKARTTSSNRAKKSTTKTTRPSRAKTTRPASSTATKSVHPKTSLKNRTQKSIDMLRENLRKPKVYIPTIIVLVVILLFIFKSAFVVALVNGQPVSRMEFQSQLEAQGGKQIMNSLVTQTLIEQEASREHVTVSQQEIDAQLKTIQAQLATQGQTLDSALAAQGLSKDAFMQQLKLQTLVQKMLASKIKVSDAEINDYISKNQASLPTGESDAQVKAQVKQQLQQQKLSQQAQALIQQLQAKAHISYFINL